MKKIGLHGSYFARNFGDTLILSIVKSWIKEYSPEAEIILPFVNSEQESIEILGKPTAKTNIQELDGLIFGPGGYFGEPPFGYARRLRWTVRNYKRHIKWNKELYANDVPYAIIGVGVGPISNRILRWRIVKLFSNAQVITVRDHYSKEYLEKWGIESEKIHIVSDVALTLEPKGIRNGHSRPKVALHFPAPHLNTADKLSAFIKFVCRIASNNNVYLLEDSKGQHDNLNPNGLKSILLKNNIELPVVKYKDPNTLIEELQDFDKIITSKLHVGIVGYALGKKVLSIPLHTKTRRFYEQIGREKFCVSLSDMNEQLLIDTFDALDQINDPKNIQFENAIKNKEYVFEFLDSINK